jgi:uncharacterized protein (TIGR02391 family)
MPLPTFDLGVLQSVSDVLGATDCGFSGSDIGRYLRECRISDPFPALTKRHRIFEALKAKQAADGCGNNVAAFIEHSMNPVRHHDAREWFEDTRSKLNRVLVFAGYELQENGRLRQIERAETHSQAIARASSLREHLLIRRVHPDVLRYCRDELLVDNYFHAVFEATKSVADKVRTLSGLTSDGSELVDEAFSFKSAIPHLALSSLRTESERSEQTGFMNLLKGLFGTFRNTTAHAPKITWKIEEQDALDILSLVSLVHRRLDSATRARAVYEGKA